jgi:subtilisin family serine protease
MSPKKVAWAPGAGFEDPFWHLAALQVAPLWEETRGEGVVVAILDGGVDDVVGLRGARIRHVDHEGREMAPWDDSNGHGTACASLAASSHKHAPGVAPEADILSINVAGVNGEPLLYKVESGLRVALESADVISCSFVMPEVSLAVWDVLREAQALGRVVVGAAGNDETLTSAFPENVPEVISVAALSRELTPLSGGRFGPFVDIAAPGQDLRVSTSYGIKNWRGATSGAAALVSGVCALVLSAARKHGLEPTEVGRSLPELLLSTATDLGEAGRDVTTGAGMINPPKLLEAVLSQLGVS